MCFKSTKSIHEILLDLIFIFSANFQNDIFPRTIDKCYRPWHSRESDPLQHDGHVIFTISLQWSGAKITKSYETFHYLFNVHFSFFFFLSIDPVLSSHVTSSPFVEECDRSHKSYFMIRTPRLMEGMFCPKNEASSSSPFECRECLISQTRCTYVSIFSLKDFEQPSYYKNSNLVERQHQSIPNIRDADGSLIQPSEYTSKMEDRSIVVVNVHFKMCVSLL